MVDYHSTMRYCFYTNIISPHQIPWCKEVVALVGAENFRYVYTEAFHKERAAMGWNDAADGVPCLNAASSEAQDWAENADVLVYDGRDIALFERRAARGLKTYCASERWFKPLSIRLFAFATGFRLQLPGWLRLFVPSFWRMARRFRRLLIAGDVTYLPTGIVAAADMVTLVALRFCNPFSLKSVDGRPWHPLSAVDGYPWMRMWGYFVAPAQKKMKAKDARERRMNEPSVVRVLWVGRMLDWKRVDTIIRAVAFANEIHQTKGGGECEQGRFTLTLVGDGPEKPRLMRLADKLEKKTNNPIVRHKYSPLVTFRSSCPIAEIRLLMQHHDIYVLASNGFEGWGAVVSEAVAEGMSVLGSAQAGASATILPRAQQFACSDWRKLAVLLLERSQMISSGADGAQNMELQQSWSAHVAAGAFVGLAKGGTRR